MDEDNLTIDATVTWLVATPGAEYAVLSSEVEDHKPPMIVAKRVFKIEIIPGRIQGTLNIRLTPLTNAMIWYALCAEMPENHPAVDLLTKILLQEEANKLPQPEGNA